MVLYGANMCVRMSEYCAFTGKVIPPSPHPRCRGPREGKRLGGGGLFIPAIGCRWPIASLPTPNCLAISAPGQVASCKAKTEKGECRIWIYCVFPNAPMLGRSVVVRILPRPSVMTQYSAVQCQCQWWGLFGGMNLYPHTWRTGRAEPSDSL